MNKLEKLEQNVKDTKGAYDVAEAAYDVAKSDYDDSYHAKNVSHATINDAYYAACAANDAFELAAKTLNDYHAEKQIPFILKRILEGQANE